MTDDICDIAEFYDGKVRDEDSRMGRHQLERDQTPAARGRWGPSGHQ